VCFASTAAAMLMLTAFASWLHLLCWPQHKPQMFMGYLKSLRVSVARAQHVMVLSCAAGHASVDDSQPVYTQGQVGDCM
jgi:hypothetical protein